MESEIFIKLDLNHSLAAENTREGQKLFNEKKFKQSLEFFENILKETKTSRGTSYLLNGIVGFGVGAVLTPFLIREKFDPIYKGAAHSCYWLKEYKKSIEYFNKIYEKSSYDIYLMAWAYYKLNNIQLSKTLFNNCFKINSSLKLYRTPF